MIVDIEMNIIICIHESKNEITKYASIDKQGRSTSSGSVIGDQ